MAKENQKPENIEINAYKLKFSKPELIFNYRWKSVEEVKQKCIVSLDTNVLLAPYKLRKESIDAIEKVYEKLKQENRLFISKQAVREFAANKSTKLAEISHSIYERKITLKASPDYPILFNLEEYASLQKSSNELKLRIEEYNKALDAIAKKIKDWVWYDPVVTMYSRIFSSEIIVEHAMSETELAADLALRNKFKIAPGYKDGGKDENAEGDLSVWQTLLYLGKSKSEDLVFVSEDRKPDWWVRSGGAALVPKYELIHEYQNSSNGKSIHFLIFSEFLEKFGVPSTVLDDVKNEEIRIENFKALTTTSFRHLGRSRALKSLSRQGIDINVCAVCGFRPDLGVAVLEIHHIKPLNQGGENTPDNLVVLCPNCHKEKHINPPKRSFGDD